MIADTSPHADYFHKTFDVPRQRIVVIPVGAEESHFQPQPQRAPDETVHVMFYGSFIGLQGPEVIARAASRLPEVRWTFLGDGFLKSACVELAGQAEHVEFVPWVPYDELPRRIASADVLLGVFGTSDKAGRVIPNKVYQSLACGRPVLTRTL